jgi:hypothetical protein
LTRRIGDRIGQLESDVDRARLCALLGDPAEAKRLLATVSSAARLCGLTHFAAQLE